MSSLPPYTYHAFLQIYWVQFRSCHWYPVANQDCASAAGDLCGFPQVKTFCRILHVLFSPETNMGFDDVMTLLSLSSIYIRDQISMAQKSSLCHAELYKVELISSSALAFSLAVRFIDMMRQLFTKIQLSQRALTFSLSSLRDSLARQCGETDDTRNPAQAIALFTYMYFFNLHNTLLNR